MKQAYEQHEAERLLPLLRSIGREIRARLAQLRRVEGRVTALSSTRYAHRDELGRLESDLSTQRRELRRAEAELSRFGCRLERGQTVRILIPAHRSDHRLEGFLDQTHFRPARSSF